MRIIIVLICCSLFPGFAWFRSLGSIENEGSRTQAPAADVAHVLWEQAIAAKGGRKRLYAVRNLLERHERNSYVALFVFPDKVWQWSDVRPTPLGLAIEMQNLGKGLSYKVEEDMSDPPRNLGENSAKEVLWPLYYAQLYYLLETQWIKPLPVKVYSGSIGRRPVDVVQTIVHFQKAPRANDRGDRVDFHLDKQSHLLLEVAFPSDDSVGTNYGRGTYYVTFADYANVDGIQMPRRVGYLAEKPDASASVQVNVQYDPEIFEHPPSLKRGPDAWKQQK